MLSPQNAAVGYNLMHSPPKILSKILMIGKLIGEKFIIPKSPDYSSYPIGGLNVLVEMALNLKRRTQHMARGGNTVHCF